MKAQRRHKTADRHQVVQARLERNPDAMRTRRETVEHPFGTIKMTPPPVRLYAVKTRYRHPSPLIGSHASDVRQNDLTYNRSRHGRLIGLIEFALREELLVTLRG